MTGDVIWLQGLAEKGGRGVVDNIDARALGRVASRLDALQRLAERINHLDETEANLARATEALQAIEKMGSTGDGAVMWAHASGALVDLGLETGE